MPGNSLATFVWAAPPKPARPLHELSPGGWTAIANPPGPTNPCCTGDVAANAVDDDASTGYSTGDEPTIGGASLTFAPMPVTWDLAGESLELSTS